ncbi:hypothetical protein JKF63_04537 [Porcisia hertigi]|uniref:SUI1 domain-containing protein n=1 Tax=Porcisia hertigi TaxID=2761500 RepID=A0A836IF69_9TRYP|nr:hypothetical protein JKF63_04537 [Porcisia hertigi]
MGRNKQKSKAPARRSPSCTSEENEEKPEVAPSTTLATCAEGLNDTSVAADVDVVPDTQSDQSDAAIPKKKEYRGNRLKNIEKKKGTNRDRKTTSALGDADEGDEPLVVTRQSAVEVLYCPVCTFPAEICEFSGMLEKCRPWLLEHASELADAEERGRKRRILTEKERLEAMLEGRGIKTALQRIVVLEVEKRTGRRMITSVFGMDLFGFNLKDTARDWRKRFSCGAGVRAAEEGSHQDCIDIQGNVADQLAEMLITKYNIPKGSVYMMQGKQKLPYPYN